MRTQKSIAASVRIALRQSAALGLSGDELAHKLKLRGSLDLIAALVELKKVGLIEVRTGRFFIISHAKKRKPEKCF